VEPDVVISKEGELICLHDVDLSTITNVAEKSEFASRKRTITIPNGKSCEGWCVSGTF
jgi:glycerophosphoryl diester phosphodiesterase